jgi:hypothetical protein
MDNREERRKLNTQTVNSAALAVLAGVGALAAVTIQSRAIGFWYILWAVSSATCLVASVVVGGRAVDRLSGSHNLFEWQARLCLLGFILGLASLFAMGPSTDQRTSAELHALSARVDTIGRRLDRLATARSSIDSALAALGRQLDTVARQMPKGPARHR